VKEHGFAKTCQPATHRWSQSQQQEGSNRTICLINMLINHLNIIFTVHLLKK
jgi:hypothetical protein